MKRLQFLLVLLALLCLLCALALTACEEAHTHTWGEWVETTAPTCTTKGVKVRVCACGEDETAYIDEAPHTPSAKWTSDEGYHWQVCTRTGCGAQVNKAVHTPAWSSDATHHWKDCAVCGYGMASASPHTYDAENTCVCGDYKDKGVQFTLSSGTYTVTDYTGTATEVVIPATYKGVAVTRVGGEAFSGCTGLTSVTIPASVTSIGVWAFEYCSNLTSVTIPASVTGIGLGAFSGCSGLTSITVASGNTKYHSAGNCLIETATGTLVRGCKNSVIPTDGSVTSIGDDAFSYCSDLTSVTIPDSVTSIGDCAFYGCTGLTSITIPARVTSIGYRAFDGCIGLTSVTFANPNGWWYASSATATSGTAIRADDLSDASTAATYLRSTYVYDYWKRT